jgi:nickel-dependent lactate racemase
LADLEAAIDAALDAPLGSPPLEQLVASEIPQSVCITFTDATRACPDDLLVPAILARLQAAGVPADRITLLCAVGLHRPITTAEARVKLGDAVVSRYRVINHDARNPADLVRLGQPVHDIPLVVNRRAVEADLLIATGVVEPHNFAGYSGGGKTVVIGCGGEETIAATHNVSMIERPGVRLGRIENNLFQEVVRAGARAAGLRLVINLVFNDTGQALMVAAGSHEAVHDRLVSFARDVYEVPIDRQFDVAIAGVGGAKDANIYQATRAATYLFFAQKHVVRPGGVVIVPARCHEGAGSGVGEQRFYQALRDAPDIPTLVADLRREGYPPGVQRTYLVARAMSDMEFVVAGSLFPDIVRRCKMRPVDTIEEGLAYAQQKLDRDLDAVIVPHALLTLPVVMT